MHYYLTASLLSLVAVSPIIFWCYDRSKANIWKLLGLFAIYFTVSDIISFMPYYYRWMPFGIQPWAIGKMINIMVAIIFYKVFSNYFGEYKFLRLKQENKIIKKVGIFCLIVLILSLLVFGIDILFFNHLWNPETTDFQDVFFTMTLPGIEEEIIYRGLYLALLASALNSKKIFGGKVTFHPGIWITGFFFGLAHGFRVLPGWEIYWDWTEILMSTVLSGAFFAWMTLKSKSIVTPILIHNSIFFIVSLVDNLHANA